MKKLVKECEGCIDYINQFYCCDNCNKKIYRQGYPMIRINNVWTKEHILVMERHLGRKLKNGEIVHHIDHNRSNNKIENLILCDSALNHKTADDILTNTPNYIKYKITKDRKLKWEIVR